METTADIDKEFQFHLYDFIKLVLDKTFKVIPGASDEEKYLRICKRCDELFDFYKMDKLNYSDETINYSDPVTIFSYIYRNTGFHVKLTEHCLALLSRSQTPLHQEFISLLTSKPIHIACIGGGPGSEAFGIQLFLKSLNATNKQNYTILDQRTWQRCWQNTVSETEGYLLSPSFNVLDVNDPDRFNLTMADNTNIVVLQYFIAEVYRYKDNLEDCLTRLFDCAKKELFILTIDMDPNYVEFVQDVVLRCGGVVTNLNYIGKYEVEDYRECLNKLEPHFTRLKQIKQSNLPRKKTGLTTTFCVCKIPAKKD